MTLKAERHATFSLGILMFGISALLVARFPPNPSSWINPPATNTLLWDLVMMVAPAISTWAGFEFLVKDGHGWAGIFFHLVILYAAIVYIFLLIVDFGLLFRQDTAIMHVVLDCLTIGAGWFGFMFYYD